VRQQTLGLHPDVVRRPGQQTQRGEPIAQTVGIAIQTQHRFERRQCQLADAQRALERVFLDALDQRAAAEQDAGLRPAQQLVAG